MKKKIALILNLLLIVFEIIGFIIAYKAGSPISPAYYTEDSNLICLIGSILLVLAYFGKKENNKVVHYFRFVSTLNLIITLLVTLFILSHDYGLYDIMIKNEFVFFHTICPILSLVSYLFFEKYRITKTSKMIIRGPIFTLIYGLIIWSLNILKIIDGPYDFLKVYENSLTTTLVSFFGMFIAIYILSFTLLEMKKKIKI